MLKSIFLFLLINVSVYVYSSHVVGGEMTYRYISKASNEDITYRVKLSLYIDCLNGNADAITTDRTAYLNVFDAKTGALIKSLCKKITSQSPVRVSENQYSCIKNKPTVCVDMYVYEADFVLPKRSSGYIISFERCCRNNVISNIFDPGNTGATYWTEIAPESVVGKNSSPEFNFRPPVFLCLNAPFTFNHSAKDQDGDSLVYDFFTPYIGANSTKSRPEYDNTNNGTPVFPKSSNRTIRWINPFSVTNQMGGNPILEQDVNTGRLTVTPNKTGQYIIGIIVKEYRKGVLIGETKRDYQFNVANCVFEVVSVFNSPKINCTNNKVVFTNQSSGATNFRWDFGEPNITKDTSISISPNYTYTTPGNYMIRLIARSTICIDTFEYFITVKENFKVNLGKDTIFCNPTTFTLNAGNTGKQFLWNTNEITQTIEVNQTGKYWVKVSDSPCEATDTIGITIDNSIFKAGNDTTLCKDVFTPFLYSTSTGYKKYLWNTGSISNTSTIPTPGKYWVTITNSNNCNRTDTIVARLSKPPQINLRDTMVCENFPAMFDATVPNYTYIWNTGETTKQITPKLPGLYVVNITNGYCSSSDSAYLKTLIPGLSLPNDTFFCGPFKYRVEINKPFKTYQWNNDSTGRTFTTENAGLIIATVTTPEGCIDTDSLTIVNYPAFTADIRGDTTACTATVLQLTANDSMNNYQWNTGENSQIISVIESGQYFVMVTNRNGCKDTGFIKIVKNPNALPNIIYMPNVFSPNSDELNDQFPDNQFPDVRAYYFLQIFNRWGEKVFETHSPSLNWDGMYKGKLCQNDNYMYHLVYLGCDNQQRTRTGMFNLLR